MRQHVEEGSGKEKEETHGESKRNAGNDEI
jgi:hypothetical protein